METNSILDAADIDEIVVNAINDWYERTGCEELKDDRADDFISTELGLICSPSQTAQEITDATARGLDQWIADAREA